MRGSFKYDSESGNYHYRARDYSPTIGRFLQRDPIGYYDSMNLFSYVNNNPLNWLDPLGLSCKWWEKAWEDIKKWWEDYNKPREPMTKEQMMNLAISMSLGPTGAAREAPIVIGETMLRVINKAKAIEGIYYKARKVPEQIGLEKALRNNYQWLWRRVIIEGRKVIDEGLDKSREIRSIFYDAEKRWLKRWGR